MSNVSGESNSISTPDGRHDASRPVGWRLLMLPTLLAIAVLGVSPNFRFQDSDPKTPDAFRTAPLGSDFLQEYVGGSVFASAEPERLYDLEYVQARQHDQAWLGFAWPENEFFPMVYPPFYYAATSLFTWFDYLTAARLWVLLGGLVLTLSAWLMNRYDPTCRPMLRYGLFASILYVPLLNNFNTGQKGTWLLLILTATYLLSEHHRPFRSGLAFGLIAFKPHLGLVIGLTRLCRGRLKFATGALLTVALLVGASYAHSPQHWKDYIGTVRQMGDYVSISGYQLNQSHSLWGAMQLSFGWWSPTAVKVIAALGGVAIIGLLVRVMRQHPADNRPARACRFSALLIGMVLLSPHFYTYDLTILLLAMLLMASSLPSGTWRDNRSQRLLVWGMLGFFFLIGVLPNVAATLRFQPSLILLVGGLFLLGNADIHAGSSSNDPGTG